VAENDNDDDVLQNASSCKIYAAQQRMARPVENE
jgi:hypothetical protein